MNKQQETGPNIRDNILFYDSRRRHDDDNERRREFDTADAPCH